MWADMEAVLTMLPFLPSLTISFAAAWAVRNSPYRFTSMTDLKVSGEISRAESPVKIPALLTAKSMSP